MRRGMARCFVTRRLPFPALDRLSSRHEVDVWPERLPPPYEELVARAADAEGVLTLLTDRVDASLIEHSPRLRAISNYAVGYDNIDLEAASARGIPVGNTPDVLTDATADLTFALLLAAARKLPEAIVAVREGDWPTWEPAQYLGRGGVWRDARDRRVRADRTGGGAPGCWFRHERSCTRGAAPGAEGSRRCSSARTSSRSTAR